MYALSTLPKRTTPLVEPSSGQYSPVLACHRILSRSYVNSTMTCEHGCGSTTGCARSGRCGTWPPSRVRALAPPVQHLLRGGYKRGLHAFKADKGIMDALVYLTKKKGAGGAGGNNCRIASPSDSALGHALC